MVEKDHLCHGAVPVSSPEWRDSPREECVRDHTHSPGVWEIFDSFVSKNSLALLVLWYILTFLASNDVLTLVVVRTYLSNKMLTTYQRPARRICSPSPPGSCTRESHTWSSWPGHPPCFPRFLRGRSRWSWGCSRRRGWRTWCWRAWGQGGGSVGCGWTGLPWKKMEWGKNMMEKWIGLPWKRWGCKKTWWKS